MTVVNRFNVNKQKVTLDPDIIENMSANDVSYNSSTQYDENTIGDKLSELEKEVIYDVTTNNNGATFASLTALLSDENLSTLIPSTVRCGGMAIRFINSSDNKYVQYRLMSYTFSTTESNWQGIDDEPTAGSDNLVKSGGVKEYLKTLEKIDNVIVSPDFSDISKWDTDRASAISVSDGVATITYDNNKTHLFQFIPYEEGKNVYCSIDVLRSSEGKNSNYTSSAVFSLYDEEQTLIEDVFVLNLAYYYSGYFTFAQRITSDIIAEKERESGKIVKYICIGLKYVGSYFGQGTCSMKNPIVIMSDMEDVNLAYVDASNVESVESITIKGVKQGFVASYNHKIDALNFNDIKNTYVSNLSLETLGISAFSLIGNKVKQVSSSGEKYLNFGTYINNITSKDRIFVAVDVSVTGIDESVTFTPTAKILSGNHITPTYSKANVIKENGRYAIGLYIKFDNIYSIGSVIADNTEYNIYPSVFIEGLSINQTELTINDVRIFKNPEWINIDTPNNIAKWIFDIDKNVDSVVRISYNSVSSNVAESANRINGITPIFKNKKLITIGDSITYQQSWQPYIVNHFGLKYNSIETVNGIYFINIKDGSFYDFGLTYDYNSSFFVDSKGVRYYLREKIGSGVPMEFRRCDNNEQYNLPLTPERTNYPKYYVDGSNNKYLPTVLSYGGQPMRVTGDSNFSIYEMSHFAKLYNPDIVIISGGTNDPNSTYGTADDQICEMSLEQCQGTITNVTVCSAIKGSIKKIMTDCPNALIFIAMPVRNGSLPDNTKEARLNLMQQYKQIAYDMGVGFIDWNSNTGITDYNLEQCFKDGVHPNNYGGWLMARKAICDML